MVPAHSRPGSSALTGSSDQINFNVAGCEGLPSPTFTVSPSAYAGTAHSFQLRPWSVERCSLAPKWPRSSAAYQLPSRGSTLANATLSPRKALRAIRQAPLLRSRVNRPLRVETSNVSDMSASCCSRLLFPCAVPACCSSLLVDGSSSAARQCLHHIDLGAL